MEEEEEEEVEEETRAGGLKGDRCLLHTAPRGRRIDPEAAAVIRPLIKCQSPTHPLTRPTPSQPPSCSRFTPFSPPRLSSSTASSCRRRRPFYTQFALYLLRAPGSPANRPL